MHRAEFTMDGTIVYTPQEHKPVDMFRMQSAMFKDRQDLWPSKKRQRRGTKALPGQPRLIN